MSDLQGTNVASTIRPFSDKDKFPTVLDSEVQGGAHAVESFDEMYRIPFERRKLGMLCVVKGDKFAYRLINNPNSDTTGAGDWDTLKVKSEDIVFNDHSTLGQALAKMEQKIHDRYVIFNLMGVETVGPNQLEVTIPYDSNMVEMTLSVPTNTVVNDEIQVAIETFKTDTKKWKQLGSPILLNKNDNTFTITESVEPALPIAKGAVVRCNILKTQEDIKTMNVLVHIKTLD